MFSMTYVSSAQSELSPADLEQILATSRVNNARDGITGILLYADGNIIQVLEGEASVVRDRYMKIAQDSRHHGAIILLEETIEERAFPEWTMGFKHFSREDLQRLSGRNEHMETKAEQLDLNRKTVQILLNNFRQMVS
jgi:hypothetical protein